MKDGRFARRVFIAAGIYGLLGVLPLYVLEQRLAEQVAFLVIGSDPARFRPLMLPAVLEKLSYGIAVLVLAVQGRTPLPLVATAVIDLVLAILFVAAYLRTRASSSGLRL